MKSAIYMGEPAVKHNDKVMSPDQFDRVVKAIVEGKYSWACVLILRFAGYNPAHYIPYRTYKRLIKENRIEQTADRGVTQSTHPVAAMR